MGIIFSNAALLARARQNQVRFDRILTIGRLNSYLSPKQIHRLATHYDLAIDEHALAQERYVDKLFCQLLGAKQVTSLDYSSHEGCDLIHDMNQPVSSDLHHQFDVVIDGGTLEHVFNFPVAIANCMSMVKPGGSLFIFTMANNHTGHGFYQFSPELFFRIFQSENGFEIRDVVLELHSYPGAELSRTTRCYSVVDPAGVRSRVGLVTRCPVMMMVHAVRTESKPVFDRFPIQSDYASLYQQGTAPEAATGSRGLRWLKSIARQCFKVLPPHFKQAIDGKRQLWNYSIKNKKFYKRWYPI